ncbi:hypothetical protein AWC38_SpisGene12223 [Stylophora pistillata]|uniref:receptor protein-tyrosine kinase n=1 Tax=Stylophora pistillata TaxID=50429 RepID=A0A2B4S3N9_STYPI|nr:hypothetical protein AWC38_SpisGene12223 [Stylophora pistillata]
MTITSQNIDECNDGTHECNMNAECYNILGSYKCTCKDGLHGNGVAATQRFTAVFTNLGKVGRKGPESINGHYTGQDHDRQVTMSNGIQQWTVLHTGVYRIEAIGASGGYGNDIVIKNGGRGARMIGNFHLTNGEIIRVLVGQKGKRGDQYAQKQTAGGGGGTFVVKENNTPLIIAGGGGGIRKMSEQHLGCDASISTTGDAGNNLPLGSGANNGHGHTNDRKDYGGGGGGFYTDGQDSTCKTQYCGGRGGSGYLQGGEGGEYGGGFGGGGGFRSGNKGPGGGGGYSGGSSGANEHISCGGGGGSFNNGTNQCNECCYNSAGHGWNSFSGGSFALSLKWKRMLYLRALVIAGGFTAMFTNLGKGGKNGPELIGGHYTGQDHDGQVALSSGIQRWTVPHTGEYRIEAIGASGGFSEDSIIKNGGRGARMIGNFHLTKDEIISVLVGQKGKRGSHNSQTAGGGGGTFVVRGSNTPLIIAGGGGGIKKMSEQHPGCDASINTTGNAGNNSPLGSGGSNGHGGQKNGWNSGGGGGGFYKNGQDSTCKMQHCGEKGKGGLGYHQGGEGGQNRGGFGGGGGLRTENRGPGGGGGYSGGGAGANKHISCGGGGGSFNVGTNQCNECCYNSTGHGWVNITFLR